MAQALAKARTIRKAEQFFSGAGAGQKASLEALLFRPVQRMCLYPLLFRRPPQIPSQIPPPQIWLAPPRILCPAATLVCSLREALSARVKLDEAEELTGRGSLGSKQSDLFRQVFECIQETLSKARAARCAEIARRDRPQRPRADLAAHLPYLAGERGRA